MIPVWQPSIGIKEKEAITKVLEIGYLGMGSKVFEFEEIVSTEVGCRKENIVATHTGQSALHTILLAYKAKGIDFKKIITPSMNNVADLQAISGVNAEPVFCDCDEHTGLIEIESIDPKNASQAQALIVLDYASNLVDIDKAKEYCDKNGLLLIYDAAHSFGSVDNERLVKADATMFSFDPIKTFTAIDAGIIHTKDEEIAKLCQTIRHMGMEQDLQKLKNNGRSFGYDVKNIGYRYHLSNVHSSRNRTDQRKEYISKKRHMLLQLLRDKLSNNSLIEGWIPITGNDSIHERCIISSRS